MNQPIATTKVAETKQFWRTYNTWLSTASDDELFQLEQSLQTLQTHEVMQLAKAIGLALRDEQSRRALPASLVQQLQEAHWPAAQATA